MRLFFIIAALCLSPAAIAQQRPNMDPTRLSEWADAVYGEAVRTGRIDGAAIAIVVDGEARFLGGYGFADTGKGTPVVADVTTFKLGSISKTFTAILVAQLQAEGRLPGLDDPISPILAARAPTGETAQQITLRHLLTHGAGLDEQLFALSTRVQDQQTGPKARIVRQPGQHTSYSNTGFGLLAAAAESASGVPYSELLKQKIFDPLGMSSSALRSRVEPDISLASGSYRAPDGTLWPMPANRMLRLDRAASGGVEASARDMQAYMIALLDQGRSGKFPSLDQTAFGPIFQMQARRHPLTNGFGMGFFLSDWNGMRVVEHGGVLPGARAYMHLIPEWNIGIFTAITGEPAVPPPLTDPKTWTYGPKQGQTPLRLLSLSEMRAENLSMLLGEPAEPARKTVQGSAYELSGIYAPERRNRQSIERALDLVRADAFVRRIEAVSPTRIRLDGRDYDEVEPGVFWRKAATTGDAMGFYDTLVALPGSDSSQDSFSFAYNDMDFVRAGPADDILLQRSLLELAALAGLTGVLFWFGGRGVPFSALSALGMSVAGASMYAVLYAGYAQNQSLISDWSAGDTSRALLLAASGTLFAASAASVVLVAVFAAARGPGGGRWLGVARLVHHAALAAIALAALFSLYHLRLIGWNAP